jgi:hypothetical protein
MEKEREEEKMLEIYPIGFKISEKILSVLAHECILFLLTAGTEVITQSSSFVVVDELERNRM